MSIIFVLIPLAIIIVAIAIGMFFWAVKSNQFDDLERQGYSILFDDDIKKPDNTANDSELKGKPQGAQEADPQTKPQTSVASKTFTKQ